MSIPEFRGVLAFPVTPMNDVGDGIDVDAYQSLLDWQIDSGVHGVIPLGSTGEFAYLRPDERAAVVAATIETVAARVPAVIGVSALCTRDAVQYAQEASKAGADAVMVSLPTYYTLTDDEVHGHVRAVASAGELPVVLYNNPYTSKVDLTGELLDRLVDMDEVVAIKEASMDINRITMLRARFGQRLAILGGGFDPYAFPALVLGADGWTTGLSNLAPTQCVELYEAVAEDNDIAKARALHDALQPLAALLVELRLSVAVKAGLRLLGRPSGVPRPPLQPLPARDEERLRGALESLGLLETVAA